MMKVVIKNKKKPPDVCSVEPLGLKHKIETVQLQMVGPY
jgi:hypothetical protein